MLKKMLGLAPKLELNGTYSPSRVALKLATVERTNFENLAYDAYSGARNKVLVIFTEQSTMKMKNGKRFSTGNHPVEALLPMLHLENAGFEFVIATPTGKPVAFEMWAFPKQDSHVQLIYNQLKSKFDRPRNLAEVVRESLSDDPMYAAVFVPGGHGAMLGIPEDENVGRVLNWAHEKGVFTITLCHGPGSLLATVSDKGDFPYAGYRMAIFPDSVDRMTPMIGYLPGRMPRGLSETLKGLGAVMVNKKGDDTVWRDRELITGASPLASNELGKLAVRTLLAELN